MDVGCYCVSGARLIAGEPLRVSAEQVLGGDGRRRRVRGDDALPRRRACALRRRPGAGDRAASSRSSATTARCCSTTRGTVAAPVIELRRDGGRRTDRARAGQLVSARGREPVGRDPRRGCAAARPRRRARPGAGDRGAVPGRRARTVRDVVRTIKEAHHGARQSRQHRPARIARVPGDDELRKARDPAVGARGGGRGADRPGGGRGRDHLLRHRRRLQRR